ncbi:hypothetical protein BZA05DRAFT_408219 [Tricharina praecox]|uniref:uncharacterized protein n=1 Tax=Tricharina praecox TaxID=43433 RepID=UPI0022205EC7|nr:uncharacterized protein BZA05DRAFT_408219 [Tricharina praecox]KAI5845356.1 hypothetical protein BZA05DRAFT_408219 [Tricharina praecox]
MANFDSASQHTLVTSIDIRVISLFACVLACLGRALSTLRDGDLDASMKTGNQMYVLYILVIYGRFTGVCTVHCAARGERRETWW